MRKLKYLISSLLLLGVSSMLHAQDGSKDQGVGKFMYSDGRSYVVIAVMLTILAGIIFYIVRIDRKLTKLEKEK